MAIEASVAGLRFAFVESPGIDIFHSLRVETATIRWSEKNTKNQSEKIMRILDWNFGGASIWPVLLAILSA